MDGIHFILIDDSQLDLFINERFIEISGMSAGTTSFLSGEDALSHIQNEANNLPKSVMLLDLQMPGMNGFEFVEKFAELDETLQNKIDIYILSSTVDRDDIERAKQNPFIKDILSKPLDIALLEQALKGKNPE